MLRPLIRPIVRPLVRGVTEPGYGSLVAQIRLLFAAGEQGAWYDPSDLSTLYQDSAGTTPVTALGQPVGLMLDKSKGLVRGPELVTNGGFDSDLSGWNVSPGAGDLIEWVGGTVHITTTGSAATAFYQDILVAGRFYEIEFDVLAGSSGELKLYWVGPSGEYVVNMTPGHKRFVLRQLSGSVFGFYRVAGVAADAYIDNISVRELSGNHASQPTGSARPKLAAGYKIDFDGVDDKLTTTFPDLGTAVTIVRSVPGTGASILTGQTIGAGARDDSTDHHGLLIINRALTAPETTLVTKWANLRAGI